jgi:hypothetical protein
LGSNSLYLHFLSSSSLSLEDELEEDEVVELEELLSESESDFAFFLLDFLFFFAALRLGNFE